jgi:arginyl-tRNA synthetase
LQLMTIKNQLESILGFNIEPTSGPEFGDYSANIAMVKAKEENKNPKVLAEEIISKLQADKGPSLAKIIDKIEVAGPGFINFWLKNDVLLSNLIQIASEKENYGKTDFFKGKKIMFEFGDANTHKLPHLGHLFSYTYGESVTKILDFAGANVRKACYQGDIGTHVAKCLWAYQKENPTVPVSLDDKVQLLQKMYQIGSKAFDEDESAKAEITALNKAIYDQDPKIIGLWKETREWSLEYYKKFEKELNVSYDRYYYESEVYKKGQEIVEKNEGKIFKRSQGALIFEGSKYGLHDRVFVTKVGTPTYEAKDMYLQELKFSEWPMDLCIITTAYEQNGYFDVIFKALETLDKKYIGKLKHIGFGMINLKTGKMSSRTGEILGAIDIVQKIKELAKEQNPDEDVSQKVAVAALKYSFLKNNYLKSIAFDLEESVAKEGNSGPYLQYTVARCNSVMQKAAILQEENLQAKAYVQGENLHIPHSNLEDEELAVLRSLIHFSEVVENAAKTYSPNLLCNYLYDLAQKFNSFYNKFRILGLEDKNDGSFRLALTFATGQVLKNGLKLLGIETPERM